MASGNFTRRMPPGQVKQDAVKIELRNIEAIRPYEGKP